MQQIVIDRYGNRVVREHGLEDGDTLRVSMTMRDSLSPVQRAIAEDADRRRARLHDGTGNSQFVGNKPGFVFAADADYGATERARQDMIKDHEQAWSRDDRFTFEPVEKETGFGSKWFAGAREGDPCTVQGAEYQSEFGSPGHLKRINGRLVCVPDRRARADAAPVTDAAEGQRVKQEAYDAMCRDKANAWRKS
jgi:hypothetical protein